MARTFGKSSGAGMLQWLGLAFIILLVDQFTKVLILGYYHLGTNVAAELPMTDAAERAFSIASERYGPQAAELHVAKRIEDDANLSMRLAGDWVPPWEQ